MTDTQPWRTAAQKFLSNIQSCFGHYQRGQTYTLEQELGRYTEQELSDGLEWLKSGNYNKKSPPNISEIYNAIQKAKPAKGVDVDKVKFEWEERDDKAQALYREYISDFDSRPLSAEAKRDGWWFELFAFVKQWAWVQAQEIAGIKNIGFNADMIEHARQPDDGTWSAKALYNKYVRPNVMFAKQTGSIEVTIPATLLNQWRKL